MERMVMITGAARGIGCATAAKFAADGWEVLGVDRLEVADLPDGVDFWRADISDREAIAALFDHLGQDRGSLDALVNNAGVVLTKSILETNESEWDRVHSTNLRAVFTVSQLAYPFLKAAKGAIVNVGSVHALATSPDIGAYAASKGGVLALTRAMALEFGGGGVRVNAVVPGAVDTEMLREGLSRGLQNAGSREDERRALGARIPLGRIGTPEEIASAILFLADGQLSSYITGQSLVVDGGALARLSIE
ncbi:MAG: SDR family oxidoreductase [Chloroflexi bacterium]|nr:SDR family oxidoreductase [Chloroflexota bacterium]